MASTRAQEDAKNKTAAENVGMEVMHAIQAADGTVDSEKNVMQKIRAVEVRLRQKFNDENQREHLINFLASKLKSIPEGDVLFVNAMNYSTAYGKDALVNDAIMNRVIDKMATISAQAPIDTASTQQSAPAATSSNSLTSASTSAKSHPTEMLRKAASRPVPPSSRATSSAAAAAAPLNADSTHHKNNNTKNALDAVKDFLDIAKLTHTEKIRVDALQTIFENFNTAINSSEEAKKMLQGLLKINDNYETFRKSLSAVYREGLITKSDIADINNKLKTDLRESHLETPNFTSNRPTKK